MGKIKAFFKKHKWATWSAVALAAIVVAWVFAKLRGSSSGGTSVVTPQSSSGYGGQATNTQQQQDNTFTQAVVDAIKNQADTIADIQSAAKTQTEQTASALESQKGFFQSMFDTLKSSIASIGQTASQAVQTATQAISQTQTTDQSISSVQQALSNVVDTTQRISDKIANASTNTVQDTKASEITNFLSGARNAINNYATAYYADPTSQNFYHGQAQSVRADIEDFIKNNGAAAGYSVSRVDNGVGYSDIVVTTPTGAKLTF